jgi:hypothetical protein
MAGALSCVGHFIFVFYKFIIVRNKQEFTKNIQVCLVKQIALYSPLLFHNNRYDFECTISLILINRTHFIVHS